MTTDTGDDTGNGAGGSSRERMLRATATLLQRNGYHGTGLNQVVAHSASPKGSLYFHFPAGKEQLAAEAVELSGRALLRALRRQRRGSTLESLDAYVAYVTRHLERSGFLEGCPIATVALEAAPTSARLAASCAAAFDLLESEVASWLEADGIAPAAAAAAATVVYAAIEGGLVLAKARQDTAPLHDVRRALGRLIPTPG